MTELAQARLIVSGDALLSLDMAARLIGGREARSWIEAHVPIRWVAGQRRVLWADVIEASQAPAVEKPSRRRRQGQGGGPKLRLANLD